MRVTYTVLTTIIVFLVGSILLFLIPDTDLIQVFGLVGILIFTIFLIKYIIKFKFLGHKLPLQEAVLIDIPKKKLKVAGGTSSSISLELTKFLENNCRYTPDRGISFDEFKEIFELPVSPPDIQRYWGKDYTYKSLGGFEGNQVFFDFQFSTFRVNISGISSYQRKMPDTFGLLFTHDVGNATFCKTVITPKFLYKGYGDFFQHRLSLESTELIEMLENFFFRDQYLVYGNDEIETRKALSLSLMENIAKLQKAIPRPMYFLFKDAKINVIILFKEKEFQAFNKIQLLQNYLIEIVKCFSFHKTLEK